MTTRSLRCRLGRHRTGPILSVRHNYHQGTRVGSLVSYRCGRCGKRWSCVTDRYLWKLDTVHQHD